MTCCLDESAKHLWELLHIFVPRHQSRLGVSSDFANGLLMEKS